MTSTAPSSPAFGDCPFCGHTYFGTPNQCRRCGQLLNEAAEDASRLMKEGRLQVQAQKAMSDTLFLVGLLLGGPMMAIGGNLRLGLFVVFGGALASVIRRYSDWSTVGTVVVGAAFSGILATWFIDPVPTEEETLAEESARLAFVQGLEGRWADVFVETRGARHEAVWFTVNGAEVGECGEFPPAEVRSHLADVGVLRVVVTVPNQSGGVCSFAP